MKIQTRRSFLGALPSTAAYSALAASIGGGCSTGPDDHETSDADRIPAADRTAWFRDAKFGMFIHWGPYSVAGVEASWPIMVPQAVKLLFGPQPPITEEEYTTLPQKFNPVDYDPEAWVRAAQQAGMRYMVITTKHHDGFCMFDAPGTDYKITNTRYGRDIVGELAAACEAAKMPLGLYYSPPDMHHPAYRDTSKPAAENWMGEPDRAEWPRYLDYMESHVRKLLTDYGEVVILWFDGLFQQQKYDPPRFHKLIRELSPNTLVNDRLGPDLADYVTPEQFYPAGIPIKRTEPAPEITPEMFQMFIAALEQQDSIEELGEQFAASQQARFPTSPNPSPDDFQLWETCLTMNRTWGYNPTDTDFKSTVKLVETLIEVVSRGGNLLLNVGPTPQGTFPAEAQERLRGIGEWMKVNAAAIYGTSYGPVQQTRPVRTTAKNALVYVFVFDWPAGQLDLDGFPAAVSGVSLLASGQSLSFQQSGERLSINVPEQAPDPIVSVLAVRS